MPIIRLSAGVSCAGRNERWFTLRPRRLARGCWSCLCARPWRSRERGRAAPVDAGTPAEGHLDGAESRARPARNQASGLTHFPDFRQICEPDRRRCNTLRLANLPERSCWSSS
ncbi:Hypothetical protein CAP_0476 [Chondromyces apiculatus DSM 436]|uniref:Uncharacterized protein n=1 Tax=Chondromyces apiculatus DSM 436 TaxID=1192034 RepID=A0A017SUZ2_9BACT|nr:Hypothetical protein CAP_0476 [Chondromyces apiculatus DSM 436]